MKKIFIIAVLIRLACLYLFRNVTNYDLQSYLKIGELTLKGINIYPEVANLHHPYFPAFLYIEALANHIGQMSLIRPIGPMGPILMIKLINTIFDLGILYLIYLLSKKNLKDAFFYAINPVTILVTTLHGQFDVIPVFFILLAVYLLSKKHELLSILSFSFAILTKTWPILFLIPILRKIRVCHPRENGDPESLDSRFRGNDIWGLLIILIIFFPILFTVLYSIFFKTTLIDITKTLVSYQGLWGIWGIWGLLGKQRVLIQKLTTLTFLISFFTYSWIIKDLPAQAGKNLIKNILKLLFFFFVFTTNFSIQYLSWIIPFLVLIKPKNYLSLIILITTYLFSFYYFWLFCPHCKIVPNWLIISQNIIGFLLWLSFIRIGYLSRK